MKKTIFLVLLALGAMGVMAQQSTTTVTNIKTPGMMLQKASTNILIGFGCQLVGAGAMVYSGTMESGTKEDKSTRDQVLAIGGAIAFIGLIEQIVGFAQIGEAGKLMEQEQKNKLSLVPNANGISLVYRF